MGKPPVPSFVDCLSATSDDPPWRPPSRMIHFTHNSWHGTPREKGIGGRRENLGSSRYHSKLSVHHKTQTQSGRVRKPHRHNRYHRKFGGNVSVDHLPNLGPCRCRGNECRWDRYRKDDFRLFRMLCCSSPNPDMS